ncbi:MAG TPA: hypothetical protein VE573_16105, partial [Nitrososphaeraceae archaeon]|nr:hypothetical protein [Nitrososphaeraceae archaeon]
YFSLAVNVTSGEYPQNNKCKTCNTGCSIDIHNSSVLVTSTSAICTGNQNPVEKASFGQNK